MAKKSIKVITLLTLMTIPQSINEGYSPRVEKLEEINAIEIAERKLTTQRYTLIEINEKIESIESKKDFIIMRLNEKDIIDSMKNEYTRRLNQANKELKEYYSKKDSIYKLIEK